MFQMLNNFPYSLTTYNLLRYCDTYESTCEISQMSQSTKEICKCTLHQSSPLIFVNNFLNTVTCRIQKFNSNTNFWKRLVSSLLKLSSFSACFYHLFDVLLVLPLSFGIQKGAKSFLVDLNNKHIAFFNLFSTMMTPTLNIVRV